jgi:hypothetical protein
MWGDPSRKSRAAARHADILDGEPDLLEDLLVELDRDDPPSP